MTQSSPERITLGKGSTLQSLSLKINEEEVLKIPQLKRQAQKVEHKGTALTTEEVMKERSSAYEFIDFEGTLEEVRENSYIDFAKSNEDVSPYSFVAGFDRGVKFAKKELELYTKEDMAESFMACWNANVLEGLECKLSFKEWFNGFKKK